MQKESQEIKRQLQEQQEQILSEKNSNIVADKTMQEELLSLKANKEILEEKLLQNQKIIQQGSEKESKLRAELENERKNGANRLKQQNSDMELGKSYKQRMNRLANALAKWEKGEITH